MININNTNSALFVTRGKVTTQFEGTTAYSPVIARAIYTQDLREGTSEGPYYRFISPKYNHINRPFNIDYSDSNMVNIDYKLQGSDSLYYDSKAQQAHSYTLSDYTRVFTANEPVYISAYNDEHFLNISESKFNWNYTAVGSTHLNVEVSQIYESLNVNMPVKSSRFQGLSVCKSGTYSTCLIEANDLYYNGAHMPSQLGCAILFKATHVPEQFCVGFKGGTGGSLYRFIGKIYNNGSHLKSIGNDYYLFYDEIIDNIPFRTFASSAFCHNELTGYYNTSNFKMQFSPPVILSAPKWSYVDTENPNAPYEQVSDSLFSGFEFVSIKTYLQFGTPGEYGSELLNNPDVMIVQQKDVTPPSVTPRYSSNGLQHLKYGTKKFLFFHSPEPYSAHPSYGYAGFNINSNVIGIEKWGDVKYIESIMNSCDEESLSSIPEEWGTWQSLTSMEHAFGGSNLTAIPSSWEGLEKVKNLWSTFDGIKTLKTIPSSWNGLNSVENMTDTFGYCSNLSAIPNTWAGLNTVTAMNHAFGDCDLIAIPNSWNGLSNVTSTRSMFCNNTKLTTIPNSWNGLDNLYDASYMFSDCTNLTDIPTDLADSCPNLAEMVGMFNGCTALTSDIAPILDLIVTKFSWVTANYASAFKGCTGVTSGISSYNDIINDPTIAYDSTTRGDMFWKPLFGLT